MSLPSTQTISWSSFDVIKGIFAYIVRDKDEKRIISSLPKFHNTLFKIAEDEKFKMFFEEYIFQNKIHYFYCEDFQTDLTNMEISGHLSSPNPRLVEYEFKEKLSNTFFSHTVNRFSETEQNLLKEMAELFHSELIG